MTSRYLVCDINSPKSHIILSGICDYGVNILLQLWFGSIHTFNNGMHIFNTENNHEKDRSRGMIQRTSSGTVNNLDHEKDN